MLHRTRPPCYDAAFTIATLRASDTARHTATTTTCRTPVSRPSGQCLPGQTSGLSDGTVLRFVGQQGKSNEWVQGACDFDEFAKILGLA
jgi:hypothetical protein